MWHVPALMRFFTALLLSAALLAPASASATEPAERVVKLLYVVVGPVMAAVAAGSATSRGLNDQDDRATMDTAIQTAAGHLTLTHSFVQKRPLTLNHSVALVLGAGIGLDRFIDME
jgi:hypothetical protein